MTHDPWSLHAALSCPACHVTGKVVRFEREDGGYQCCDDEHIDDVDPYVCVECGQTWADTGVVGDVKDYRVQYMRKVEGRPYEPPKPKEPEFPAPKPIDYSAFDAVLKEYYRQAAQGPTIKDLVERAKSIAEWHKPAIPFHRSSAAWNFQSVYDRQRSKVLPTGDIVTDLGGIIQISGSVAWGQDDMPWTSVLVDDSGGRTILVNYRTKQYHWNLATDEVTEK
jgi:hypothetical protein